MNPRHTHIYLLAVGLLLAIGSHAQDSTLNYPLPKTDGYPFSTSSFNSPLYLQNPSNIRSDVFYDPLTKKYLFSETIGTWNYRNPTVMSEEEYELYELRQQVNDYWRMKSGGEALEGQLSFIPPIQVGGEAFDKIFGSNVINITPSG